MEFIENYHENSRENIFAPSLRKIKLKLKFSQNLQPNFIEFRNLAKISPTAFLKKPSAAEVGSVL